MSVDEKELTRLEELACDSALFGLDVLALSELDAFGADSAVRLELELAAGEVAARAHQEHPEVLPAALAERLLAQAARVPSSPRPWSEPPRSARERPSPVAARRTPVVPWLVAAAAIGLAFVSWLRDTAEPAIVPPPAPSAVATAPETPTAIREGLLALAGTQRVPWTTTGDASASGASGDVVWHGGAQRGVMHFHGLATNDPAVAQYQLWIFDGARDERYPVDGGVFDVASSGDVLVPIAAKLRVNNATLFAVTVERPGGVVVSKRERVVLTAAPPPT